MPPKPVILAFDTSAAHCAAALLSGDTILASAREDMARGQAERIMPLIQEVIAKAGITLQDVEAIGVGIGPGNFTGIRISVSAARGLALSLGVPAIGVSSLETQAFGAPRPIWALVDARRGSVYAQRFEHDTDQPAPPALLSAEEAAALTGPRADTAPADPAAIIARIAAARLTAAQAADQPIPRPAPLYVRNADAAPPRDPAPVILP